MDYKVHLQACVLVGTWVWPSRSHPVSCWMPGPWQIIHCLWASIFPLKNTNRWLRWGRQELSTVSLLQWQVTMWKLFLVIIFHGHLSFLKWAAWTWLGSSCVFHEVSLEAWLSGGCQSYPHLASQVKYPQKTANTTGGNEGRREGDSWCDSQSPIPAQCQPSSNVWTVNGNHRHQTLRREVWCWQSNGDKWTFRQTGLSSSGCCRLFSRENLHFLVLCHKVDFTWTFQII